MRLGTQRANLPAGDKGMFYDLVANYAAALFVWYVQDFQGSDLAITGSSDQGKFTNVDSKIVGSWRTIALARFRFAWRLAHCGLATSKVYGLSIAMRKMFEDTLNASKGDFKPLYAKLREAETW